MPFRRLDQCLSPGTKVIRKATDNRISQNYRRHPQILRENSVSATTGRNYYQNNVKMAIPHCIGYQQSISLSSITIVVAALLWHIYYNRAVALEVTNGLQELASNNAMPYDIKRRYASRTILAATDTSRSSYVYYRYWVGRQQMESPDGAPTVKAAFISKASAMGTVNHFAGLKSVRRTSGDCKKSSRDYQCCGKTMYLFRLTTALTNPDSKHINLSTVTTHNVEP
eukprot:284819583_2